MIFGITINYKNKELYQKVIKIPLNTRIKVMKEKDTYIITLENDIDTHLFEFKEEEVSSFSIERVN